MKRYCDLFVDLWPYLALVYLFWLELQRPVSQAPVFVLVLDEPTPPAPAPASQEAAYGSN